MTTRDGSFNRIAMSNYMDTVVKAYLAFLRAENPRDIRVTFMPKEIRIFRESSGHTYSFSIENEERTFAAVRVSITSEHSTSTSMYMPDGTQPTADIIRDHVEAMRGSDDEARRSKLREFFREVVHVYRKAALKPSWEMTNHEDVHGWGTGQSKVWIEVKYDQGDRGGVLVSIGGHERGFEPSFGLPTLEFARSHITRKDDLERAAKRGSVRPASDPRLAREDAEPKEITNVPSWFGSDAPNEFDHTGHIFSAPVMVGSKSHVADVLGKMGRRAARETHAIREVDADAMRKTLVGLGLQPTTQAVMDAVEASREYRRKVADIVTRPGPRLFVDMSHEYDSRPLDLSHMDRVESADEWTARKTAELEARFSATIRNTLREWPSHQGVPMIIHTHVDQGVFVLTLKAAP